ncbi:hypothetical protein TRVA0_011S01574 [Trichomonascus vanleenenianus]|uniref:uncharacterized protein n=1 Tax=Trichomonascus vanleenenianus TaxID=2268995 RepID=UPI003ECB3795
MAKRISVLLSPVSSRSQQSILSLPTTVYAPEMPHSVLEIIFQYTGDLEDIWHCSLVRRKWNRAVKASDEDLVKHLVLELSPAIHPQKSWLAAGLRYIWEARTLGPREFRVVSDSMVRRPSYNLIPPNFGAVKEINIHNGKRIDGLNDDSGRLYLRQWKTPIEFHHRGKRSEGVCILDFNERTFEYIETRQFPARVDSTTDAIEIALTVPDKPKIVRRWTLPHSLISQVTVEGDDRTELGTKLRLSGPRNGELMVFHETCRDELLSAICATEAGVKWVVKSKVPRLSQLVTKPDHPYFAIVSQKAIELYESATGQPAGEMENILESPPSDGDMWDPYDHSGDYQLTSHHLVYFSPEKRTLYACPFKQIMEGRTSGWKPVLQVNIGSIGGRHTVWNTCRLDHSDDCVLLTANHEAGVGLIVLNLPTGKISAYAIPVDELDPVQAMKYHFSEKHRITGHHSDAKRRRRQLFFYDGIWAVDRHNHAAYFSDMQVRILRRVYLKRGYTGPVHLDSAGPWIDLVDPHKEEKPSLAGRFRKQFRRKSITGKNEKRKRRSSQIIMALIRS